MLSLLLTILLTLRSCYMPAAQTQEDDPVVTCTSRPPLHNGKLQIPINGFAFYTCEIELKDHTPYKTESWYLRHVRQNHPEIAIATSTQDNEPCLFSNKTCNRMIAMIVPKAFELQNMTTKGCALLNRSSLCSSSSFTIEIIEEPLESTTTQPISMTTSQTTQTSDTTDRENTTYTTHKYTTSISETEAQGAADIFGLTANGVSLYNLLINSIQIILLAFLVFKSVRGCTRKQEHTQANDVEAGFSRDQVRDLRSLPRQNSNPNPQRITRNQQIQNSLVPNDQLAFDDYDSTHSNERKDYINLQTRIDTPVSDTTEGTGSQSGPPEYETQSSLLLSND